MGGRAVSDGRRRQASARALYLELASMGICMKTGEVPPSLNLSERELMMLKARVGAYRSGLVEVLAGEDADALAIREEATA